MGMSVQGTAHNLLRSALATALKLLKTVTLLMVVVNNFSDKKPLCAQR